MHRAARAALLPTRDTVQGCCAPPARSRRGGCLYSRSDGPHCRRSSPLQSMLEPGDRFRDLAFVHFMHFCADTDVAQQGDRELAAEVLAEFAQADQHGQIAIVMALLEQWMPQAEAELFEQRADADFLAAAQPPYLHRIAAVERESDSDRLAMTQRVVRQDLQLVRGPMAVVERTRAAGFERIAAVRNLAHVQLGAAPDHIRHRLRLERDQLISVRLEPCEEHRIADQR